MGSFKAQQTDLGRVEVDANDLGGLGLHRSLHAAQAHAYREREHTSQCREDKYSWQQTQYKCRSDSRQHHQQGNAQLVGDATHSKASRSKSETQ